LINSGASMLGIFTFFETGYAVMSAALFKRTAGLVKLVGMPYKDEK